MPNKPDNNKQIIDKLNKQIREFQAREDEYLRQL